MKTNAVRLLESLGVQYELREYEVDPEDLAAETVAAKIGMPPEQVFKTLLARGDRHGLCFAVIPANTELDLKTLAQATGDRKMELVPVKELLGLTGYIRGGVTVLGAKKAFPVVGLHFHLRRRSRDPDYPAAGRLSGGDRSRDGRHRARKVVPGRASPCKPLAFKS
jgi:Cys-tRNA(Pro)/Cys-tRNA(Cys) deacylase